MAIRKIRTMGDRILNKVCRPVEEMTPKIQELIDDMLETMYDAYGVGLAAPQVGMLKRIVVIDIGDENGPYVLINPVIIETAGEQRGFEGCLSVPGNTGVVTRPDYAKVKTYDEDMLMTLALDNDCLDFVVNDDSYEIYTSYEDFIKMNNVLNENNKTEFIMNETRYIPQNYISLNDEVKEKIYNFIDTLEDLDDVQDVYHNMEE